MSRDGTDAGRYRTPHRRRTPAALSACLALALALLAAAVAPAAAQAPRPSPEAEATVRTLAATLAGAGARLERLGDPVAHWRLTGGDGALVAVIGSSWEIARSTGYSGKPIEIVVAVDARDGARGRIAAVRLARHDEPILTLGLSDADIERFTAGFEGIDLGREIGDGNRPPEAIARATVTSGVMRDGVLRTARALAGATGLIPTGGIDRTSFRPMSWAQLVASGAVTSARLSLAEAREAMAGAKVPLPDGQGSYITLFAGLIDPPSIGRSLLGEHRYQAAVADLAPGQTVLFVGSWGLVGHRGTGWRRSGVFDPLSIRQDGQSFHPRAEDYARVDRLALADAPEFEQMSLFRLPARGFDPTRPFTVELEIARPATGGGQVRARLALEYALPAEWIAAVTPPAAAWEAAWAERLPTVIAVAVQLGVLFVILLFQTVLVRRARLWLWIRAGFLTVTFLWLGLWVGGQLSVVQVAAFLQALLSGFRWETFLIEPVIFVLWGFVALGLLFWGRGVYCGWLCPFGAAQELSNLVARRLGVRQIAVPFVLHERLWLIKYTAFVAIVALSFYSMKEALWLAEIEPFKTAIALRMVRAWPFVLFVVVLMVAGLFIERFYCRYLCPLGAGLAIPAKLRIFDWLDRRPQCGRECRLCEQKCTVGAIDPLGRINPNECVLCLRCQMIYHDPETCVVLKRRRRAAPAAAPASGATP